MNKTRVFSLLLSLVILISCLPVLPVSAAEELSATFICGDHSYVFTGSASEIAKISMVVSSTGFTLSCGDTTYTHVETQPFVGYKFDPSSDDVLYIDEFWIFNLSNHYGGASYTQYLYPYHPDYESGDTSSYTTTITIDGEPFTWSSSSSSPTVTMTVTSTGCTMTDGVTAQTYSYSGSQVFQGLSLSSGGSVSVSVGSQQVCSGSSGKDMAYAFYSVASAPSIQTYSTTVYIGSNSYVFSAEACSPSLSMTVTSSGLTMTDGTSTKTYYYDGSGSFQGFSTSSAGALVYSIGDVISFDGSDGQDKSIHLYPVAQTSVQTYYSTIKVGDSQYVFSSTVSTPKVTITVNNAGASLTDGSKTFAYTYSGEGTFQGLSYSATGSASFVPGESYSLAAGDHTLYAIASSPVVNLTATFISGDQSYIFEGTADEIANISMVVSSTGFTLSCGDTTYTHVETQPFVGYKFDLSSDDVLYIDEFWIFQLSSHYGGVSYIQYLYPYNSSSYTNIISIGSIDYSFSGSDSDRSPDVTLTVTEDGCTLTDGVVTYSYLYPGVGTFSGFACSGFEGVAYPVGFSATFSGVEGASVSSSLIPVAIDQTFHKVTSDLDDWTGTYLIVYEISGTAGYLFTGVDAKQNVVEAVIADGVISTTASTLACCPVKIVRYGEGYSIQLLSSVNAGKYISASTGSYNKIIFSNDPQQLTISYNGLNTVILDGEKPFQFNKSSSYQWFRFFGAVPGGQSEIALYRLDETPEPETFDTVIDISGQQFIFSSYNLYPKVTVAVTETGCTLSDGAETRTWTFDGDGKYKGLSLSSDVDFVYLPGVELSFQGSSSENTFQLIPYVDGFYHTAVVIDGFYYTFYSSGASPTVTMTVTSTGCTMTDGVTTYVYEYQDEYAVFAGFSLEEGTVPTLLVGTSVTFNGQLALDQTFFLFAVGEIRFDDEDSFRGGVFGWFQRLFDLISKLPDKIRKAIFGEDVLNSVNDASSVLGSTGLFRQAYNALYAGWGLRDLLEDPDGPFAWLLG